MAALVSLATVSYPYLGGYGRDTAEIVNAYYERRNARDPLFGKMRELRDTYNGDVVVPLPELDKSEVPAVANLIASGIDQLADRIASVLPNVYYPPLRPGFKGSEDKATIRRRANLAWWDRNGMDIVLGKRARYFVGYGVAPVLVRPDTRWGMPRWEVRNPLLTFPCPTDDPADVVPSDCIFTTSRTVGWLRANYPDLAPTLQLGKEPSATQRVEILEYCDDEVRCLIALGTQRDADQQPDYTGTWQQPTSMGTRPWIELLRVPNRAATPMAVVPSRVTLDRVMGQFMSLLGMYKGQARLMALDLIAIERGIFPDTWLVSSANEQAELVTGPQVHDGRTGLVNIVRGGTPMTLPLNPGVQTGPAIDRVERNMRVEGGIPAEFGGESNTNIRTGRRGDAVMSAAIDPKVAAAHLMLQRSLSAENEIAMRIARGYFGSQPKSYYVTLPKAKGPVDYLPDRDFEATTNSVSYPLVGVDQQQLTVEAGQLLGMRVISKETFREIHPMIGDPEQEESRVSEEQVDEALVASFLQSAQTGAVGLPDMARVAALVREKHMELVDAILQVHDDAQARQASSGPPGTPEGPVPPGSPPAQPGLAPPGAGEEQPSIPPTGPSQQNLVDLLRTMRQR